MMNVQTASAREDEYLPDCLVPGRTAEFDNRCCWHEASHAVIKRLLSAPGPNPIGGVSVQPGPDFDGLCWGAGHDKEVSFAFGHTDAQTDRILALIASTIPPKGEAEPGAVSNVYAEVFAHTIEAVAGVEGERLFVPGPPSLGESDLHLACGLASLICSPGSVDAFIAFCRAEATELLKQHSHVVLAIAEELRIHRELNGSQVDAVIAQAVSRAAIRAEHERRAAMRRATANAVNFTEAAK
jgi:hypothetical protein